MTKDTVFVTESHYLLSLVKTLQYDTIYHEHLRYYHLSSLIKLFSLNNLEVFHAKKFYTWWFYKSLFIKKEFIKKNKEFKNDHGAREKK